jgi:nickel/cobalt exporter
MQFVMGNSFTWTLYATFLLGMLHALEPGHGKTALFAHLTKSHGSFWTPFRIGITMSITHTLSILGIAIGTHFLIHHAVSADADAIPTYLGLCASLGMISIGALGLWREIGKDPSAKAIDSCCAPKAQASANKFTLVASPNKNLILAAPKNVTKRGDKVGVFLGIGAGLMPCPSALAAFFGSIGLGSIAHAITGIALFGLGIAVTITLVGIVFMFLGKKLEGSVRGTRFQIWLPRAQASVILLTGFFYFYQTSVNGFHSH